MYILWHCSSSFTRAVRHLKCVTDWRILLQRCWTHWMAFPYLFIRTRREGTSYSYAQIITHFDNQTCITPTRTEERVSWQWDREENCKFAFDLSHVMSHTTWLTSSQVITQVNVQIETIHQKLQQREWQPSQLVSVKFSELLLTCQDIIIANPAAIGNKHVKITGT